MAQTNINIRIDSKVKKDSEKVFEELGMTMTTAITIFLKKCIKENGIPFNVNNIPNAETLKVIKEGEEGKNLLGPYNSVEDMLKEMED